MVETEKQDNVNINPECGCGHHHNHADNHNFGHNHEHNHEHNELSLPSLILAAGLFAAGMITEHLELQKMGLNETIAEAITMVFYFAAFLLTGKNIIINAIHNLMHGELMDETLLLSISAIGAILLGKYEEATAIMILYQAGTKVEDYAVEKNQKAIEEISKLRPEHATVKIGQDTKDVSPDEVETDSIIIVQPGDRIPIDGIVTDGESFVDNSALTGESIPCHVGTGDKVLSGSINKMGVLEIRTTKQAGDSTFSQLLEMVEHANKNKTRSEQFVTRFARIYTPIVVLSAIALTVIPGIITGLSNGIWDWQSNWSVWGYRSLMFLVVSCPCALVISIPLTLSGGITACAKNGILVKGSSNLEALNNAKTAVFDKTGTLTKGNFAVTHIHATDNSITERELLALTTHTEMFSTHPISASLKIIHHDQCCDNVKLENIEEIAGKGIKAIVNGKEVLVGNTKLMDQFGIKYSECQEHQDGTVIHVVCNGIYAGHIVISDEIKDDSQETVEGLKKAGVKNIVMLTGDNERAAHTVAAKLGLHKAYSQLLTADKLAKVEELMNESNRKGKKSGSLIFVGDRINDAPVLACADVGIAMGAVKSDAAVEAADVIIMEDKPSKLVEGIKISHKAVRIVYENLIGFLGIKGLILICSALGITNMWIAVLGDSGVTVLAILNSLRMLHYKSKME